MNLIEIREGGKVFTAEMNSSGTYKILGEKAKLDKMLIPVQCNHCGKPYDLCETEVIHRYADCTLYKTPCCNRTADDREWKSCPDFTKLTLK